MADYKSIHGVRVVGYTADPDNIIEGQIWFDKTASTVQYQIPNKNPAGIWRTGNNMGTARYGLAGGGTQTSALAFGGGDTPPLSMKHETESYDGTSWTELANLGTARYGLSGTAASNTAAIAFGGYISSPTPYGAVTETWDGSSWTEVGDLNTGGKQGSG